MFVPDLIHNWAKQILHRNKRKNQKWASAGEQWNSLCSITAHWSCQIHKTWTEPRHYMTKRVGTSACCRKAAIWVVTVQRCGKQGTGNLLFCACLRLTADEISDKNTTLWNTSSHSSMTFPQQSHLEATWLDWRQVSLLMRCCSSISSKCLQQQQHCRTKLQGMRWLYGAVCMYGFSVGLLIYVELSV